jgi:hypothetical protein
MVSVILKQDPFPGFLLTKLPGPDVVEAGLTSKTSGTLSFLPCVNERSICAI